MSSNYKTPDEIKWIEACKEYGCATPDENCMGQIEYNHICEGGRRLGHLWGFAICWAHHQAQSPLPYGEVYHKGHKAWTQKHGKPLDFWQKHRERLGFSPDPMPLTKVIPRP